MRFALYTQPKSGPLSWAKVRSDVQRVSDDDFRKHASAFYKIDSKKGFFNKLTKTLLGKKTPKTTKLQRPGFLQGFDD